MHWLLGRIFGTRVALSFGALTFIFVAVLSALYLECGYAIQSYVGEQLKRIPWDIAVGQRESIGRYREFQQQLQALPEARRVANVGLARVVHATDVLRLELDGEVLPVRWLVLVTASDPELLVPGLRVRSREGVATAALVGAKDGATGAPIIVSGERTLRLRRVSSPAGEDRAAAAKQQSKDAPKHSHDHAGGHEHAESGHDHGGGGHDHGGGQDSEDDHHSGSPIVLAPDTPDVLFDARISAPIRLERQEFNKWMLRTVGSLSYLPDSAMVVAVSPEQFIASAAVLDRSFASVEGIHGGAAAPPYVPEVTHLVKLDASQWLMPWQFTPSLGKLLQLQQAFLTGIREVTVFSNVSSDAYAMLQRMQSISGVLGALTLLIALPLLWLGWAIAQRLAQLLLMNERRLIGLARLRGVPLRAIEGTLLGALVVGGVIGVLLGIVSAIGLLSVLHGAVGEPGPPIDVLLHNVGYFVVFALLGILIAVLAGFHMIRRMRRMSPLEAAAFSSSTISAVEESVIERQSVWTTLGYTAALLIAALKFAEWITGESIIGWLATRMQSLAQPLAVFDDLLSFLAVPLGLFGVLGLLAARMRFMHWLVRATVTPVTGRFNWFVASHLMLNRSRTATLLLVISLAVALALLPRIAADTFYGRTERGIEVAVGADVQISYDLAEHNTDGPASLIRAADQQTALTQRFGDVERALRTDPAVARVAVLTQQVAPDVFLPGQSGLRINVIQSPAEYLETARFQQSLGVTRDFSDIIHDSGSLAASTGLLSVRNLPLNSDVVLGRWEDDFIGARFTDVLAYLPGQPSIDVTQREGYAAAEVDYLNYLLGTDARAVTSNGALAQGDLGSLGVLPSSLTYLVGLRGTADDATIDQLVASLPVKPHSVRWVAEERRRLSKDMFISLALANMKVFLIGGLALALAGVGVIAAANFVAERRTFSLLRLRGVSKGSLLKISCALFMAPVLIGTVAGSVLGTIGGLGISEEIWRRPKIYGVAAFLPRELVFSNLAVLLICGVGALLLALSLAFALVPFRRTAHEGLRDV